MIDEVTYRTKDKKVYKVGLILLVGLASISGARKDLNQLLTLANEVHAFANHWLSVLPVNQASAAAPGVCQLKERTRFVTDSAAFPLRGRVVQGKSIKIKGLNAEIKTINGGITIDLPVNLNVRLPGETLNDTYSSEFGLDFSGDEAKAFERFDWRTQAGLEDANR